MRTRGRYRPIPARSSTFPRLDPQRWMAVEPDPRSQIPSGQSGSSGSVAVNRQRRERQDPGFETGSSNRSTEGTRSCWPESGMSGSQYLRASRREVPEADVDFPAAPHRELLVVPAVVHVERGTYPVGRVTHHHVHSVKAPTVVARRGVDVVVSRTTFSFTLFSAHSGSGPEIVREHPPCLRSPSSGPPTRDGRLGLPRRMRDLRVGRVRRRQCARRDRREDRNHPLHTPRSPGGRVLPVPTTVRHVLNCVAAWMGALLRWWEGR